MQETESTKKIILGILNRSGLGKVLIQVSKYFVIIEGFERPTDFGLPAFL
jgi:hypothetical protein